MRRTQSKGLQFVKLTIVCCASLSLLSVPSEAKVPDHEPVSHHERRSLAPAGVPPSPAPAPVGATPASVSGQSKSILANLEQCQQAQSSSYPSGSTHTSLNP
ncbi:hypothetical protein PGTUg99_031412 [Puccinia graminis f. sp. tritici]|uniref:Uncharacterized protein n=1 Tax=Puccinia graminis f. sp. tritici TaxID=56615 RepID=A0A5B0SNE1_PUCGR|nr:hypothetical protein PGTUg99_031412 [Puccinia graminis f. sp. tritici]